MGTVKLLNPRQLPALSSALFGEGNVNAAIMIQLSRPSPRVGSGFWIPGNPLGDPTDPAASRQLLILVISP